MVPAALELVIVPELDRVPALAPAAVSSPLTVIVMFLSEERVTPAATVVVAPLFVVV